MEQQQRQGINFDTTSATPQDLLMAVSLLAIDACARERGLEMTKMTAEQRQEVHALSLVKGRAAIEAAILSRVTRAGIGGGPTKL